MSHDAAPAARAPPASRRVRSIPAHPYRRVTYGRMTIRHVED